MTNNTTAALTDEQILALNVGEIFFSESPSKFPEAGHGTQYHAGAPGVLSFARAIERAALLTSPRAGVPLADSQVEWVVNDSAELGVKISNQFFFLYKGESLVYETGLHDDGSPMHWRHVGKREFGECAHPINYENPELIGAVSLDDGKDWRELPGILDAAPAAPVAEAEPTPVRGRLISSGPFAGRAVAPVAAQAVAADGAATDVCAIRELLADIENSLTDSEFDKIDTKKWNAVSAIIGRAALSDKAVDAAAQQYEGVPHDVARGLARSAILASLPDNMRPVPSEHAAVSSSSEVTLSPSGSGSSSRQRFDDSDWQDEVLVKSLSPDAVRVFALQTLMRAHLKSVLSKSDHDAARALVEKGWTISAVSPATADTTWTTPKQHCQNGGDVCLAGNRDGVCCPEDSCDIDDGTRKNPATADERAAQLDFSLLARLSARIMGCPINPALSKFARAVEVAARESQAAAPTPQQISDYLHMLDAVQRELVEREARALEPTQGTWFAKTRASAPAEAREPAMWQVRTRPTWDDRQPWSKWEECSKEAAADYRRTPVFNEWEFEVRELFDMPFSAPADAGEAADVTYDDVVSACDAHGITLPVDAIDPAVELINHFGQRAQGAQGGKGGDRD